MDAKRQVAALPVVKSRDGETRVILMTSRETRRWVIPKGWPMKGLKNHEAAAREAFEEAGLLGKIQKTPIGTYDYFKRMPQSFTLCDVDVYLMKVSEQLDDFPEKGERSIEPVPLQEAVNRVDEAGLKAILAGLVGKI